jgi:hypothetical protein
LTDRPTIITLDPTTLKDSLQTDPALLALMDRGYSIASTLIVQDGEEGRGRLGLILVPPAQPPPTPALSWPTWTPWAVGLALGLLGALVALLSVLVARA